MFAFSHFYGQFVLRASILRVMFKYLCAFLRAIAYFGVYYFLNFASIFGIRRVVPNGRAQNFVVLLLR